MTDDTAMKALVIEAMYKALDEGKPSHAIVAYDHEHSPLGGCRTQSRCACEWRSDSYVACADAQRAGEVHVRRATREDFDDLIARSSIGAAIADIKARGIDAHLVDLEREMTPRRRRSVKKPHANKTTVR